MEMVSDVTFQTFRPISVIWGTFRPFLANFGLKLKMVVNWSCDHSKWPQEKQKSNGDGLRCHFSDIQVNFGHLGPFLATFGQFGPKTYDFLHCPKWHRCLESDIWNHHHQISACLAIIFKIPKGQLTTILSFGPKLAEKGPKWPKLAWTSKNDIRPHHHSISASLAVFEW